MTTPIRITFREGVDHLIEAQSQVPSSTGSPVLLKAQKIIWGVIFVAALVLAFVQAYRRGIDPKVLFLAIVCVILIVVLWLWFFKKIGLYKTTNAHNYQWTKSDRERVEKIYLKRTGQTYMLVAFEFDNEGFTFSGEHSPGKKYPWNTIPRAIERPKGVLIYNRSGTYLWVPRAAFASGEDYQATLSLISSNVSGWEKLHLESMAYVALGSNLGNPADNVRKAISAIRELSAEPFLKSSLWQTSPVDCPPGSPPFVNAVVALTPRANETPESLLLKLQRIEKTFGRSPKKVMNEPRPLDLDIIAFGKATRQANDLVLPHPRAYTRKFVLQPLSEIAPGLILPGQGRTASQLLAELSTTETLVPLDPQ